MLLMIFTRFESALAASQHKLHLDTTAWECAKHLLENLPKIATDAGAALASTPAQNGQHFMPKSKTTDLIAPSLAKLPNALDAEYWLNRIKVQEDLGSYLVWILLLMT